MKVLVTSDLETILNARGKENPEYRFFTDENIKKIEETFDEVVWNKKGRPLTKEELIEMVKDCDAAITCWAGGCFDKDVMDNAPNLKIIAHLAGSVALTVTEETYNKGVLVIGANDREFSKSVAEGALAYTLTRLRRLDETARLLREKKAEGWGQIKYPRGLIGKTVGIVSFGAIAEYFVQMLQPFNCNIKVYSRSISEEKLKKYNMTQASLEEIFSTCDVISLHTAWNKHTEKMINRDLIKMMKDNAILINTARGAIVDEEVLTEELVTGRIQAALDVFYPHEPLPSESPLYDCDNVLIVDHRGGPTTDMYKIIASNIIDDVYNYLKDGTIPDNVIKKERGLAMTIGG